MNIQKGFALGLALGFAFGLGGVVASAWAPAARAQTTATRWEYMYFEHNWDDGRWLNAAGAQGWELVTVNRAPGQTEHAYMRRRVP